MSYSALGLGRPPAADTPAPISGRDYLLKLRKYLATNIARLAPAPPPRRGGAGTDASWLAQGYTLLTLGLDSGSAPLSRGLKVPLTLGFGAPAAPTSTTPTKPPKPVLLRLPPDKLLYLLLRWQSLPQQLPYVGHTDVPVPDGVVPAARGTTSPRHAEGDVESVRSWVGSIRSVSVASRMPSGWFSKPQEVDEDKLLLELYTVFNTLPGLLIHPPFSTDPPVTELLEGGGYTPLGGIDVRVPLDVLRNLQILELDGFDPRGLLIPPSTLVHSLTAHDVGDGDDWIRELLVDEDEGDSKNGYGGGHGDTLAVPGADGGGDGMAGSLGSLLDEDLVPRFPNLRHLSLHHCGLLNLPSLPLTSVTHLDLSNNLLNAIPDALSALHNLVSLNLSSNLITSVRNAASVLGNVGTINLSHNRIDCLVGLDRVLGLRRVDVRANELIEADEVGRLAVLPQLDAVWAVGNPFAHPEADWRVEVATAFAGEGHDVKIDDTPLSWAEARRVDALLAAKGKRRPRLVPSAPASAAPSAPPSPRSPTATAGVAHGLAPPSPARATAPPTTAHAPSPLAATAPPPSSPRRPKSPSLKPPAPTPAPAPATAKAAQPTASPIPSPLRKTKAAQKKRAKRRVVNLDDAPDHGANGGS